MSINATTSSASQVSSTQSTTQASSASNSDSAKKTSSESSFKDEMNKVDSNEKSKEVKDSSETKNQDNKVGDSTEGKTSDKSNDFSQTNNQNLLEGGVDYSNFASMSMLNANNNLTDNIQQIYNITTAATSEVSSKSSSFFNSDSNAISMTEDDANFFIILTQNNDVSMQNVTAQAQNLLDNGAEVSNVKQNVQVSQALLDALNNARETNQPLRIDFDQNVSVVLRIGKDGSFAANFIPGDKAVEQYLKANIDSLKATFRENDLPYSDLSYSSRGKQQQKENRRNKQ
jgi:hypothetical protein